MSNSLQKHLREILEKREDLSSANDRRNFLLELLEGLPNYEEIVSRIGFEGNQTSFAREVCNKLKAAGTYEPQKTYLQAFCHSLLDRTTDITDKSKIAKFLLVETCNNELQVNEDSLYKACLIASLFTDSKIYLGSTPQVSMCLNYLVNSSSQYATIALESYLRHLNLLDNKSVSSVLNHIIMNSTDIPPSKTQPLIDYIKSIDIQDAKKTLEFINNYKSEKLSFTPESLRASVEEYPRNNNRLKNRINKKTLVLSFTAIFLTLGLIFILSSGYKTHKERIMSNSEINLINEASALMASSPYWEVNGQNPAEVESFRHHYLDLIHELEKSDSRNPHSQTEYTLSQLYLRLSNVFYSNSSGSTYSSYKSAAITNANSAYQKSPYNLDYCIQYASSNSDDSPDGLNKTIKLIDTCSKIPSSAQSTRFLFLRGYHYAIKRQRLKNPVGPEQIKKRDQAYAAARRDFQTCEDLKQDDEFSQWVYFNLAALLSLRAMEIGRSNANDEGILQEVCKNLKHCLEIKISKRINMPPPTRKMIATDTDISYWLDTNYKKDRNYFISILDPKRSVLPKYDSNGIIQTNVP